MTIPFTYLIGWSAHDTWYYGVRYARDCSPVDLWTTYFTSSKYVTEFRKIHGEPDVIRVRKVFDSTERAVAWEDAVIRRAELYKNKKFLNKSYSGSIYYDSDVRKKISDHAKRPRSQSFGKARSEAMKKLWDDGVYDNRPPRTDAHQEAINTSLRRKYAENVHHCKGRQLPQEHKEKIANGVKSSEKYQQAKVEKKFGHPGQLNHMYGKSHHMSTKEKIKQAALNRPKVLCSGCGKLVTNQVLARYHKGCNNGI